MVHTSFDRKEKRQRESNGKKEKRERKKENDDVNL
jgi:hypothetical protein